MAHLRLGYYVTKLYQFRLHLSRLPTLYLFGVFFNMFIGVLWPPRASHHTLKNWCRRRQRATFVGNVFWQHLNHHFCWSAKSYDCLWVDFFDLVDYLVEEAKRDLHFDCNSCSGMLNWWRWRRFGAVARFSFDAGRHFTGIVA